MTIAEILRRFENPKKSGNGWQVKCPSHADRVASLSITNGGGKILLHCHAGCTAMAIVASLGLRMGDLFAEPREYEQSNDLPKQFDGSPVTTAYEYRDAEGNLRYRVLRTVNKDFPQQRLENGKWIWKGPEVKYLYRLPELLADDSDQPIFIPEGEKDVDALRKLGLLATCNSGGAEKFTQDNEALRGRTVVILPDNDAAGSRHAAQVEDKLQGIAAKVITLEFEDLPDKGDVSDWIKAGGTKDQLLIAVDRALKEPALAKKRDEAKPEAPLFAPSETLIRPHELTVMGLAAKFHERYRENTRYVLERNGYFNYEDGVWSMDICAAEHKTQTIINMVHEECQRLETQLDALKAAFEAGDKSLRPEINEMAILVDAFHKFLKKIKIPGTMGQILQFSRSQLKIEINAFDGIHNILNLKNGTVDLDNGRFRAHQPADFCSMRTPVKYDKEATCPRWTRFLEEIFLGDQSLVSFIKRLIGYSISGYTDENVFLILYGGGSNGKTELLWVLEQLMGDYLRTANVETFMDDKSSGGHNEDIARLRGARIVTTSETEKSRKMAESIVKRVTGGDAIVASFKHERSFEFRPCFTIWMAANHKPVITGTDYGIWRRILLIPFSAKFVKPGKELNATTFLIDKSLRADLGKELPGILRWAIEGYAEWRKEGLNPPEIVQLATKEYEEESDKLGAFLTEEMVAGDGFNCPISSAYEAYRKWAEAGGMRPCNVRSFSADIKQHGIEIKRMGHGNVTTMVGYALLAK